MEIFDIIIKFIKHSCFTLETKDYFFIIDYFEGKLPKPRKDKKTVFIATHSHKDHFSKDIFKYGNFDDNIYILSKDIMELYKDENIIYLNNPKESKDIDIDTLKKFWKKNNVFFLDKNERLLYDDMEIFTYGSTDKGFSILVELPYVTFYHAGDLNDWVWPSDTEEEKIQMKNDFRKEVDKIQTDQVDIAFFPVDPRLKENYNLGVSYFLDQISPEVLFPMHMWGDLSFSKKFKNDYRNVYTEIKEIDHEGEEFFITMEVE